MEKTILEEEEEENLDSSWIQEFQSSDRIYSKFYADPLLSVSLHFVYMNESREITHIKKTMHILKTHNLLSKEELIPLVKSHNEGHALVSLLRYHVDLDTKQVASYAQTNFAPFFLQPLQTMEDICFSPCIQMFHPVSKLYFLFVKRPPNFTRKYNSHSMSQKKTRKNI